ncbi:hypothetical protein TTHERM_00415750 (macronuclear) [Tetrahymena thermophila SB210]|uniref:Kinase domain protein n=1 Tax=Tetrahymena thermophila (strain SB210) TaxID=312017 RepID=Q22P18_TETTS|nr:hypothetical protein TTHERM_00415750 [Tetrahymena thermophila SB210]EAR86993.2 hypothetical protein TTHERM_00415750 [Tetrahymena thermophila SB210]|eukprot:XP_001007238.2 hypothetical protein TTHERM_00415750 [Tetrahymena thermophila SB210]
MLESKVQNIKDHQRHIQLSISGLSNEQAYNLCHKLKGCYQIETIVMDVSDCKLTKQSLSFLSNGLEGHKKLSMLKLELSNNILDSQDWVSFGRAISSYSTIKNLELCFMSCNLDRDALKNILNISSPSDNIYLFNQAKEVTLDLQNNQIRSDGSIFVQQILESCKETELINIYLWNNYLGDMGAQRIGRGIGMLSSKLKILNINLSNNSISKEGCQLFFQAIVLAKVLEDLSVDISDNKILNKGCMSIGESLSQLLLLSSIFLNLSQTIIDEGGFIYLIQQLRSLIYLSSLSIDVQKNSGITKQSLQDCFDIMKKEYECIHTVTIQADGFCLEEQVNSYYIQNESIAQKEVNELEKYAEKKIMKEKQFLKQFQQYQQQQQSQQ